MFAPEAILYKAACIPVNRWLAATTPPNLSIPVADTPRLVCNGNSRKGESELPPKVCLLLLPIKSPAALVCGLMEARLMSIQQPPVPITELGLVTDMLQSLPTYSCLQNCLQKTKRGLQQVTCSYPVTTLKPASDAASSLFLFPRRNRVVFPRDPVAPASQV